MPFDSQPSLPSELWLTKINGAIKGRQRGVKVSKGKRPGSPTTTIPVADLSYFWVKRNCAMGLPRSPVSYKEGTYIMKERSWEVVVVVGDRRGNVGLVCIGGRGRGEGRNVC